MHIIFRKGAGSHDMTNHVLHLRPVSNVKDLFTPALKLKRNDRMIKLNWAETKVSQINKKQVQSKNSSWLMLRLLA